MKTKINILIMLMAVMAMFLGATASAVTVNYGTYTMLDADSDLDLTGSFEYVVGVGDRQGYCPLSVSDGSNAQTFYGDIDADGPYPPDPDEFIEGYAINYQHAWNTGDPSGGGLSANLKDILYCWGYKDVNGGGAELEIDMDVTSGQTYKLQLAWQYNWTDGRDYLFDVYVEGTKVIDNACPEVDIVSLHSSTLDVNAMMYTYTFVTSDSNLDVNITYAGESNKSNDWLAFLNLLTLEGTGATNPSPAKGAEDVAITANLSWSAGGSPDSYDVYFGTNSTAVTDATTASDEFEANQTATSYDPGTMDYSVTYYWRVDEVESGTPSKGPLWYFDTNKIEASNPAPAHEGIANSDDDLAWDDEPLADSYDVYFGTDETAVTNATTASDEFMGNQTAITYDPPTLTKELDYYWRVDSIKDSTTYAGDVWDFYVRKGNLKLLDEVSDVDLTGCIIYGINCARPGTVDDDSVVINGVKYVPDIYITCEQYDSNDVNGDGINNWHDQLYNATCPGKPSSPTPIPGMTVECSDADINSMDNGLYDSYFVFQQEIMKVTSKLFEGQGEQYFTPLPPSSDTTQCLRYLLSYHGQQNLGNTGDRNSVYRFDTIEGNDYKLQVLIYYVNDTYDHALELYIRPNNATDFVTSSTSEEPEISLNIEERIAALGGTVNESPPWATGALLYTYEFTGGSDGKLDFEIVGNPTDLGPNVGGINAIILEDVSAVATAPSPMNMEYYTSWQPDLSWTAAAGADSHSVYFGTDYDTVRAATTASDEYQGNQTATTYDAGQLVIDTTYYWRVDEVDGAVTTTGETWSFTPGTDTATWKVVETTSGEWVQWEDMLFPDADYRFTANLSTTSTGKSVRLEVGGSSLGSIELPNTDGYMRKFHMGIKDAAATRYDLRFVFEDGGVELDYLFLVKSTSTTTSVLPTDTRLVAPSSSYSFLGVTSRADRKPKMGWPDVDNPIYGSEDIYSNHNAWDRTMWDYRVDEALYARLDGFMIHANGVYDPNGAPDHGPFYGTRPTWPNILASLNKVEGAREFFKIGGFECAASQIREFWEPGCATFNVETDTDDYHYWSENCYSYTWNFMPKDMWWEDDGYTPFWMLWSGNWRNSIWDPADKDGKFTPWIDHVRSDFTEKFGTNFHYDAADVDVIDSTCNDDDVQSQMGNNVWEGSVNNLCKIGSWYGKNSAITCPAYRPVCEPGCDGELPWADGTHYDEALDMVSYYDCVVASLECFDDPQEGVEICRTNTDTYPASVLSSYPSHRMAIIREHSDPALGSLRCEAEFADTYSDSTPGRNVDPFMTILKETDLDASKLMGRDIGVAVNPFPYDCEIDVPTAQVLSWAEAYDSDSYDVYFGTTLTAVMNATTASDEFIGNQTAATYDPSLSGNTTYYWRVDALYSSTAYPSRTWRLASATVAPTTPTVTNSTGESSVTDTTARLNGEVTVTGGEDPTAIVYWGDNDGGTTPGSWDNSENKGTQSGTFYHDASSMNPNTAYYYRCYASNSGDSDWADSTETLTTLVGTPTVTNSAATDITDTTATLNGEVTATGGENPTAIIYWGDNDAGTAAGSWDNSENKGAQSSTFSQGIASLDPSTTYYFRSYASNSAGSDWADSTAQFDTTSAGPLFSDGFEDSGDWSNNWSAYGAWNRVTARANTDSYSAEIDGAVTDSTLESVAIDVSSTDSVDIEFYCYIEGGLDSGEYVRFDVKLDSGSWTEKASIDGNSDPEDSWEYGPDYGTLTGIDVSSASNLYIRFRGTMNKSNEDAYVDDVVVTSAD